MKVIAVVVSSTLFVIKSAINIISAIVKSIYYAVTLQWGKIEDTWEKWHEDQLDDTDKLFKVVQEIKDSTFHIERNTESDDLKVLRELYAAKMINEDQFYSFARVAQKDIPFEALDTYTPTTQTVNNEVEIKIEAGDETWMNKVVNGLGKLFGGEIFDKMNIAIGAL